MPSLVEEQLAGAFHAVRDARIHNRMPLVFWDEFDADECRWLKHFLAPMQDGCFQSGSTVHPLGRAVFVFAGGTSSSFECFADEPQDSDPALHKKWRDAKIPDFTSRLRGFLDVKGPNPVNVECGDQEHADVACPIRRAIMLRANLLSFFPHLFPKGAPALIDPRLVYAFLRVEKFVHGSRSLANLVSLCVPLPEVGLAPSSLPAPHIVETFVSKDFYQHLESIEAGPDFIESLAIEIHKEWRAYYREIGGTNNPNDREFPDLAPDSQQSNRNSARNNLANLRTQGFRIVRGTDGDAGTSQLDEPLVLAMMRHEHDRWMREKLLQGFAHNSKRNDAVQLHPDVALFDRIPLGHQEYDRRIVNALAPFLAANGLGIERVG